MVSAIFGIRFQRRFKVILFELYHFFFRIGNTSLIGNQMKKKNDEPKSKKKNIYLDG